MRKLTMFHTIRKFTERAKLIWQKKLAADITKCLFFAIIHQQGNSADPSEVG